MIDVSKPEYGNWVSVKLITRMLIMFAVFAAAGAAALVFIRGALGIAVMSLLALLAAFFLAAAIYFVYARRLFSDAGGGVQKKVLEALVSRIKWSAEVSALDIGCGSGALAIMLANKYPGAHVTGCDYWGGSWGYSKAQCESNASLEGVDSSTEFISASASKLPFADGAFDLAVSNLVFHEIKDSRDKREPIREALRVVKKGGSFVFQDAFALTPYFGTREQLLAFFKSCGAKSVAYEDTSKLPFIPRALKLPFMLGSLGLVYGTK